MSALKIKKGTSSHSAYDLRDPHSEVEERHTLAIRRRQRGRACWRGSSGCLPGAATTSKA